MPLYEFRLMNTSDWIVCYGYGLVTNYPLVTLDTSAVELSVDEYFARQVLQQKLSSKLATLILV